MQWDDPVQNNDTDLDLYLYGPGGTLLDFSDGTGLSETILWTNNTGGDANLYAFVGHYRHNYNGCGSSSREFSKIEEKETPRLAGTWRGGWVMHP